jgi:putative FmdB family regulatory protein
MPIYAYKCESCGFAKDVLQKMSDPQLTECPSCGASAFKKQLTAAGFQLKGSGWYATDFKGGTSAPATATGAASSTDTASKSPEVGAKPSESSAPKTDSAPPAASGGCGGPCACH